MDGGKMSTASDAVFTRRRTLKRAANLSSVNEELVEHAVSNSPTKRDHPHKHAQKPSDETENSDGAVDTTLERPDPGRATLATRKRGEKLGASIKRKFKELMRSSGSGGANSTSTAPSEASRGKSLDIVANGAHNVKRGHSHSFSADLSSATTARLEERPTFVHSQTGPEEQTKRYSVPAAFGIKQMPSISETLFKDVDASPALAPLTLDAASLNDFTEHDEPTLDYASHHTTSPVNTSFLLAPSTEAQVPSSATTIDEPDLPQDEVADQLMAEAAVPPILQRGLLLTKLSEKRTFDLPISLTPSNSNSSELNSLNIGKNISIGSVNVLGGRRLKRIVVRVDPDQGHIIYESGVDWVEGRDGNGTAGGDNATPILMGPAAKGARVIPIECIREIRMGADAVASLLKPGSKDAMPDFTSPLTASFPFIATHSSSHQHHPSSLILNASPPLPTQSPLPQTPPKISSFLPASAPSALASRLLTIIYTVPHKNQPQYKSLNLVFPATEQTDVPASFTPSPRPLPLPLQASSEPSPTSMCQLFCDTLRKLRAVRLELMNGLGNVAVREAMWERILWKEGDVSTMGQAERTNSKDNVRGDGKLEWSEVEALCRKLNVSLGKEELKALFKQSDVTQSSYLTFDQFRKFLKMLKKRPEVKRLYKQIIAETRDGKHLPGCPLTLGSDNEAGPVHRRGMGHPKQRSVHHPHPIYTPLHINHHKSSSHDHTSSPSNGPDDLTVLPLQRSLSASHTRPRPIPYKQDTGKLHRALSVSAASHHPNAVDADNVFDFCAFCHFMKDMQKSPLGDKDLRDLFERYLGVGHHKLGDDATAAATPYGDPASPSLSEGVNGGKGDISSMSLAAFAAFLLSPANAALFDQLPGYIRAASLPTSHSPVTNSSCSDPTGCSPIYQDMTRPLPEYFISSSHNTYLVGHQLVGTSTTEGYVRALLAGCRSVEVDIFDGDVEPMIFHGKTLTSKVSLRAVCRSIAKYGFVASPYPIIISAEMHLTTIEQQDMMAQIMLEEFGDTLIKMPADGPPVLEHLPSPEDLRGKVLLKTKNLDLVTSQRTKGGDDSLDMDVSNSSLSASETDAFLSDAASQPKKRRPSASDKTLGSELQRARSTVLKRVQSSSRRRSSPPPKVAPMVRSVPSTASTTSTPMPLTPTKSEKPKQRKMSMALAALLVYTIGVKCRGLNKKEQYAVEHMFSLSENTINKMLREVTYGYDEDHQESAGMHGREGVGKGGMMDLIKHCRTHLVRTYPKGMRVDSSNYEPHRYWSAGAQLVALNWQTCDVGFMINHAMFQRNGRCGYVLKPLALRSAAHKHLLNKRTNHFINLTIISAQQLPRAKDGKTVVDPYVEVTLHVPEWTHRPFLPQPSPPTEGTRVNTTPLMGYAPSIDPTVTTATSARQHSCCTSVVKHNGFNPVWEEPLQLPFDCVGDMKDLIFIKFTIRHEAKGGEEGEPLAVYCASLGSLQLGYRHLPLHDMHLTQYLFSTLFVRIDIQDVPSRQ